MMVSAANDAMLISNSVVPNPMAMYFIVIYPFLMSAPVTGAFRFVVIEATFISCCVLLYARFVQSLLQIRQNRALGHDAPFAADGFVSFFDK